MGGCSRASRTQGNECTATRRRLSTLPPEILIIVVSHIDHRRGLVCLALTSKIFYHIIVPSFLEFVHIRCDPRRTELWQWLISKPYLAARIRTLELYDEQSGGWEGGIPCTPIIPAAFSQVFKKDEPKLQEEFQEGVLLLAVAVMHMQRLSSFRWSGMLPVVPALESLLVSLEQQYNVMRKFSLFLSGEGVGEGDDDEIISMNSQWLSPMVDLSNITTLCLTIDHSTWSGEDPGLLIPSLIMKLKTLENLLIAYVCENPFDFLVICERAHWPSLVELCLEGNIDLFPKNERWHPGSELFNTRARGQFGKFLQNHPTLERLMIATDGGVCSEFIPPKTECRLRSLIIDPAPEENWMPPHVARQIEYLECTILLGALPLLRTMTSLHILDARSLSLDVFEQLVEAVPHLQRLRVPFWSWCMRYARYPRKTRSSIAQAAKLTDTVVNGILKLKNLVQLEGGLLQEGCLVGGFIHYSTSDSSIRDGIVMRLMEHERLTYIDSLTWAQVQHLITQRDRTPLKGAVPSIKDNGGFLTLSV